MKQSRAGNCQHCDQPITARRLCNLHYQRWYKYGDALAPLRVIPATLSIADRLRFVGWTETPNGCREWAGSRFGNGYGRLPVDNTTIGAHRASYEAWVGPIGEGLLVRHKCDNPPCINPDHLETGTNKDNMQDMVSRGRSAHLQGEACAQAKLSNKDVIEIRRLYETGLTQTEIGPMFGTTNKNVHEIVHNKTWTHLLDKGLEILS